MTEGNPVPLFGGVELDGLVVAGGIEGAPIDGEAHHPARAHAARAHAHGEDQLTVPHDRA
jgi:hypothetical protein